MLLFCTNLDLDDYNLINRRSTLDRLLIESSCAICQSCHVKRQAHHSGSLEVFCLIQESRQLVKSKASVLI